MVKDEREDEGRVVGDDQAMGDRRCEVSTKSSMGYIASRSEMSEVSWENNTHRSFPSVYVLSVHVSGRNVLLERFSNPSTIKVRDGTRPLLSSGGAQ
jgi:hypothetical protein